MKKVFLSLLIFFTCSAIAQNEPVCNGSNSNGFAGIPLTSCAYSISSYSIGMDAGLFFVDTGYDVTYNGKKYRLRLAVTSSSAYYKDYQAILQTAYATRSKIQLIYPNFALVGVGDANVGMSDTECRMNHDNEGNPANMYCPIQAVELLN